MDRNLGAENLDPGIRPAVAFTTNGAARIPSRTISKRSTMAKGSPSGHTTAKILRRRPWRGLRHPATLLGRAADPSDPAQRLSSWLGQPSPNLWGNASTGGRPTTAGAKSIYDPCPPGWRVPPPEAWTLEQTTVSSTIEGGCYLYTGSVWPYYPYAGLLHVMPTGKEMYVGVGIRTQLWTNARGVLPPIRHVWMRRRP